MRLQIIYDAYPTEEEALSTYSKNIEDLQIKVQKDGDYKKGLYDGLNDALDALTSKN